MFQVLAMNPSNSIKGTLVKVDFFGINWLNCGIDTAVIVDVFKSTEITLQDILIWMLMLFDSTELLVEWTIPWFLMFFKLGDWARE